MKKLLDGIVEFRRNLTQDYRDTFKRLALGQRPDALFVACSDSRVVPNLFASTNPGDVFVVRNVGNLIAPCGKGGMSIADESEAAAIEFSVGTLGVKDIIVCGHSECGAMIAITNGREKVEAPNLRSWLRHGEGALARLPKEERISKELQPHNRLSQLNVLAQLDHAASYPMIRQAIDEGRLRLHGWWFDIARAEVHAYDWELSRFVPIDEEEAARITRRMGK